MIEYGDEDLLMLSGIQHFCFCPRQWALIHLEQAWSDNTHTIEGEWFHQKVDDPTLRIKRKDIVSLRSVSLVSRQLGLYGLSDVVELHKSSTTDNTITHPHYEGYWTLYPIEYKKGKPKKDERDEVQLCAQTLCLEEMHKVSISEGALYYGEIKHREVIQINDPLRKRVEELTKQMHEHFRNQETPLPIYKNHCKSCSLIDVCLPKSFSKPRPVNEYLKQLIDND